MDDGSRQENARSMLLPSPRNCR